MRRIHDLSLRGTFYGALLIIDFILPLLGGPIEEMAKTTSRDSLLFVTALIVWLVIVIVMIITSVVSIIIACIKGKAGANEFGPDPLEQDIYLVPDVPETADDHEETKTAN